MFDLDNTLIETNRANNDSYREAILTVLGEKVEFKKKRFTRSDLSNFFPNISSSQINEIVKAKDVCYINHISETTLNIQLVKILKFLNDECCEVILLTNSHKSRAKCLCDYYQLSKFFKKQYYKENYGDGDKYQFLTQKGIQLSSVILFENEQEEILKAIQTGINENQIINVKF
ncbi:MAG: hypothetical protein J5767_07125 [Paludibacteraceae bacterium]|nr:hypothetical protein [Paludibacteraceae bacterium]